jgi:hypothetical protein
VAATAKDQGRLRHHFRRLDHVRSAPGDLLHLLGHAGQDDVTGRQGVDVNALLRQFVGQGLGIAVQGCLGSAIGADDMGGNLRVRIRRLTLLRRAAADIEAPALPLAAHTGKRLLQEFHRHIHIEVVHGISNTGGCLAWQGKISSRRVVHQDIDIAKALTGPCHQGFPFPGIRKITGHRGRPAACRLDLLYSFLKCSRQVAVSAQS